MFSQVHTRAIWDFESRKITKNGSKSQKIVFCELIQDNINTLIPPWMCRFLTRNQWKLDFEPEEPYLYHLSKKNPFQPSVFYLELGL